MIANLYACEPALIARLKARVPELATVDSTTALGGNVDSLIRPAAAFVGPLATLPQSDTRNGARTQMLQRWEVVVCVPHKVEGARHLTPYGARTAERAGPFVLAVMVNLAGWSPADGFGPLSLASDQPDPDFTNPSRADFPVVFETKLVIPAAAD